jgi:hypothetical protein
MVQSQGLHGRWVVLGKLHQTAWDAKLRVFLYLVGSAHLSVLVANIIAIEFCRLSWILLSLGHSRRYPSLENEKRRRAEREEKRERRNLPRHTPGDANLLLLPATSKSQNFLCLQYIHHRFEKVLKVRAIYHWDWRSNDIG